MTKQEGKTYFYVETKQEARRRTISIWQEEIDDESLVQEGKKMNMVLRSSTNTNLKP
jgi:hypothetical protein